jgi:hypothetical protein
MYLIVRITANVPMGKLPILGIANAYIAIDEGGATSLEHGDKLRMLYFCIFE